MNSQSASKNVDVSVIIPAYRSAATIGRALDSVIAQTVKPIEVIVVVDGLADETYQLALNYEKKMGGISFIVLSQQRKGAGAARNKAISEARGKFIAFLDADDEWLPEKLEKTLSVHETGNYAIVSHNVWVSAGNGEIYIDCARHFNSASSDHFESVYRRGFISTSTTVANRQKVIEAGGFDETLAAAQDFDLWLSMLDNPVAGLFVFDEALTRNYLTEGSITSNTAQRLNCSLRVALRYVPHLKERKKAVLTNLSFRVLAVHREALTAYKDQKNYFSLFATFTMFPISLVGIFVQALVAIFYQDINSPSSRLTPFTLDRDDTFQSALSRRNTTKLSSNKTLVIMTWGWIGAMTIVYLFQFRNFFDPLIVLTGLR